MSAPGRRAPRVSNTQAGVLVLVLAALVTYFGFRKEVPFRHHDTLKAAFSTANNLRVGSPVRIAGVNVGKVTRIEHLDGRQAALVTMRLDKAGLPLHEDARAAIRPRIFLEGNFFVDVQPGSPSAPELGDGGTIPIGRTAAPVQLDQVLGALQQDTRRNLQGALGELSDGLADEGARGFNRSTRHWRGAYRDGAIVADATRGELEHDLSQYVDRAGQVAAALDRDPRALQSLITDFDTTATALADREADLSAGVAELPRTLRAGMPALAALNAAFPPLKRLTAALRPPTRSALPAINATLPLVTQLRGLVQPAELRGLSADLRPTVPALAKLNRRTVPLYRQVRAASSCQNEVVLPWTKDTIQDPTFPATGPVYVDSLKALPGLAGESRTGDANGQWFRVLVEPGLFATPSGSGRFMFTGQPLMGVNPPVAARPPLRSDVPCETQDQPDLRTIPTKLESRRAVVPEAKQGQLDRIVSRTMKGLAKEVRHTAGMEDLKTTTKRVTGGDLSILRSKK